MADELVDYYDENMTWKGQVMKSEAHKRGLWHCSIHCWIVRSYLGGSILLQKRAADKDLFPNMLDISAAGHYQAGEDPEDGVREILEELGLSVPYSRLVPLGIKIDVASTKEILNHEFCRTYFLREEKQVREYVPDPGEVEGLVEMAIPNGLALFAGERDTADVSGIEWNKSAMRWDPISLEVTTNDFIPRVDSYYYKVFIMAERLLDGAHHLAI